MMIPPDLKLLEALLRIVREQVTANKNPQKSICELRAQFATLQRTKTLQISGEAIADHDSLKVFKAVHHCLDAIEEEFSSFAPLERSEPQVV